MASQSDQDQPRKESGNSSSSDVNHNPSGQSPATVYPPTMGYPPAMGYPPGQPGYPYPGYNQYHHHHQHPYTQPPPAAYYNPQAAYYQQQAKSSGLVRGILSAIILVVVLSCMTTIITSLVLRPQIPEFRLETFSVSNFSTKPGFTANWEGNFTIENPNHKLRVYGDRIESFVFYNHDEILASSDMAPFKLDTGEKMMTQTKLSANNTDHGELVVGVAVVDDMAEERSGGSVKFSLRLMVWSTFKSGWWTRHIDMRVYCEDLKVVFDGVTGNGKLTDNKPMDCTVRV
ncbi:hypothetical protein HS088_TW03G00916 [Tripterygium wilfordii]|uniref:Late embryogenesis abundant protein LEA-2 subgroup domain-containing protein n=1 Tax=Tripterygium wilfordii TaxID=458696 RepID=A0A7J7DW83_TRIWF|nr:NDR1/HIN1-like protein 10 [Tripterygium wilfordii]KAF5750577.1 hypothetical protein HS088_TW03G00916 [Tripterygium wilfordii]